MHDSELKNLLLETHPVRPGQEERAWTQLKDRLSFAGQLRSVSIFISWPSTVTACLLVLFTIMAGSFMATRPYPASFASAASQSREFMPPLFILIPPTPKWSGSTGSNRPAIN